MKKFLCAAAAIAVFMVATDSAKADLAFNAITATNPSASNPFTSGEVVTANVITSGIGRGSGITANAGTDRYNASSWSNAFDATDYFTFTLGPAAGYQISFTDFIYVGQRSGTGPNTFAFRSSLDGFTANIGTPTATGTTIALSAPQFQNVTSAVEFRFYGWGSTGGTFSINSYDFNGSVAPIAAVPEPMSMAYASVLAASVGVGAWRRRRNGLKKDQVSEETAA